MPPTTTSRRPHGVFALVAFLAAATLLLAACGGGSGDNGTATDGGDATTTTKNPYGEAPPVDPPAPDEVVLTVTGPNGSTGYTLAELREKSTTTITVNEPFVKQTEEFSGVPMRELLDTAGITGDAEVDTVALNDYTFSAPASTFTGSDAIIAVSQNGTDIAIDKGGPIRIVFPDGKPATTNLDAWTWSLGKLEAAK